MLKEALFSPVTLNGAAEKGEELNTETPPAAVRPPAGVRVTDPLTDERVRVPKSMGVEPVFSSVIGAITLASIPILVTVEETWASRVITPRSPGTSNINMDLTLHMSFNNTFTIPY
jgi:hypothetical protein